MHIKLRRNISTVFSNAGIFRNLPVILTILFFPLILSGCGSSNIESSWSGKNGNTTDTYSADMPDSDPDTAGSVKLAWNEPIQNADGSELTDLAGYKVYYGAASAGYTRSINVGNYTSIVISNLSSGVWCFAVSAYDHAGNESDYSVEACTTI